MFLELSVIAVGIVVSFFLKDVNFLALNVSFFNTGLIYPDFLLIFLIFFALNKGEFSGIWIGFFAGLLEDSAILSFSQATHEFVPIIGTHAIIYTITGFILGKINRIVDRESQAPMMVVSLVTTFAVRVLTWILMGIIVDFNKSYSFIGPAIFTAIISPIWFTLLSWLYRIKPEERV